jgi:hypothetical protein
MKMLPSKPQPGLFRESSRKQLPFGCVISDSAHVLQMFSRNDEESRFLGGSDNFRAKEAIALVMILHGARVAREIADAKLSSLRGEALEEVKQWTSRLFASEMG